MEMYSILSLLKACLCCLGICFLGPASTSLSTGINFLAQRKTTGDPCIVKTHARLANLPPQV